MYISPWDKEYNECHPICPNVMHPVGTWQYLVETGTLGVGGQVIGDVTKYYKICMMQNQALDSGHKEGLVILGKISAGMISPKSLAAFTFLNKAKQVTNIFIQILHLDDFILAEDCFNQGRALGKITKELEGLSKI